MNREQLLAMGLTEEQVNSIMAMHGSATQGLQATIAQNNTELTNLRNQIQSAPQPNPTPDPTPNPEPDDNTRALQERIEQLERENVQKDIRAYAAEKGLTGEQAESVLAGFQTDLEAAKKAIDSIAQIISDKETAAATAKEQELLKGTPNPGGGTGGNPGNDKPEDVKNAESISFGSKADEQSTKDYYVLK